MKILRTIITLILISASLIYTQTSNDKDTSLAGGTLQNCVQYAMRHQPQIQQTLLDEQITEKEIGGQLSAWYPQINLNINIQHNYQLPVSIVQGNVSRVGLMNTSGALFSVTQNIFNRDALLASSTAGDVRLQSEDQTINDKILVVVNVSKAYYSVLLAQDQLKIIDEDIKRLDQNSKDTYSQYKSGLVDKTDYMRASIALNNALAEKKQDSEQLKVSFANLKELMGYPSDKELPLTYDRSQMENDVQMDTAAGVIYENRIEYKLLKTRYNLQEANLKYYEWSFIPSLYAFGEYNFNFMNDNLSNLYNKNYPNSYIGIGLSLPIFEGGKRFEQISQAGLELKRYKLNFDDLKASINTEYTQALANYKSDLNNYNVQKDNLDLAKEVYNIIQLQYKSGVKAYLDVITAETDLRTTEINYITSLYRVLSSKIDLEKALGTIKYQ